MGRTPTAPERPSFLKRHLPHPFGQIADFAFPIALVAVLRIGVFFLIERDGAFYLGDIYRRVVYATLLYFVFAAFINRFAAVAATIFLVVLLRITSDIKVSQIGEPLSFVDLTEVQQNIHLFSYATTAIYILIPLFLLLLIIGWKYRERGWRRLTLYLPLALILPGMFAVLILSDGAAATTLKWGLDTLKIRHRNVFVPTGSVGSNGVIGELLQTAQIVDVPERGPHHFYDHRAARVLKPDEPDLIVILCESCFTTQDNRFPTAMRMLAKHGLQPFEMLSPVFGGDTAEAEFETLTGLSSSVIPGVDYQQYGKEFRPDMGALPRRFDRNGYLTVSMHNYFGLFWRRNVMHPKLGFRESIFLENMDQSKHLSNGESHWARDAVLYDAALRRYRATKPGEKTFFYLITVATHGKYAPNHPEDLGKSYYLGLMKTAMGDMDKFLTEIDAEAKKRGRPLAIVVFGDHKPALQGVFYQNGVLPKSLYSRHNEKKGIYDFVLHPTPEDWKARSAVSVYARFPDPADTQNFARVLNDRPLFCLPAELSALVPNGENRFWEGVTAVCRKPVAELLKPEPYEWVEDFPRELYAERLFD